MAEEKFLLVSLKEDEAKQLAQVISNDTSRKILDHLSNLKDDTETNIAKKLKVPISTVHYNLKALVKAKLIQANEFHYSEKGKEVNHYSLANKYVIIAPKNTPETLKDKLRKILPVIAIIGFGTVVVELLKLFFSKSKMMANEGINQMDSIVREAAPMVATKSVEIAEEATTYGASESEALQMVAQHSPSIFISHPTMWFLYGVVLTVVIFVLVDYIQSRKK